MDPEQLKALMDMVAKLSEDVTSLKAAPATGADPIIASQRTAIQKLQADMAAATKRTEAAEAKALASQKTGALEKVLGNYNFVSPQARATAAQMLDGAVKFDTNGVLIAGDNLTPEAYATNFLTVENSYLLAPANSGGSGAQNGTAPGAQGRGTLITTEMIKPGMPAADRAAVWAQIGAVLKSGQ